MMRPVALIDLLQCNFRPHTHTLNECEIFECGVHFFAIELNDFDSLVSCELHYFSWWMSEKKGKRKIKQMKPAQLNNQVVRIRIHDSYKVGEILWSHIIIVCFLVVHSFYHSFILNHHFQNFVTENKTAHSNATRERRKKNCPQTTKHNQVNYEKTVSHEKFFLLVSTTIDIIWMAAAQKRRNNGHMTIQFESELNIFMLELLSLMCCGWHFVYHHFCVWIVLIKHKKRIRGRHSLHFLFKLIAISFTKTIICVCVLQNKRYKHILEYDCRENELAQWMVHFVCVSMRSCVSVRQVRSTNQNPFIPIDFKQTKRTYCEHTLAFTRYDYQIFTTGRLQNTYSETMSLEISVILFSIHLIFLPIDLSKFIKASSLLVVT